jgi:alpha-L-rhamnosidase
VTLPGPWRGELVVATDSDLDPERPIRFRRSFVLPGQVTAAQLFITACGVFEAEANGQAVGDHVLAPGWTSYHDRHRVMMHDVAGLLVEGDNVLDVTVAEGWYRGRLGFTGGRRANFGEEMGPIVHLVVQLADGASTVVASDASWQWATGPILRASLYDGESADLRLTDSTWHDVRVVPFDTSVLFLASSPPVRRIETLAPASIETSPSGRVIVDFGQNIAGRVRLRLPSDPGRTVTLHHAEVLQEGELALEPLRGAAARDEVVCGESSVEWEPAFTMHGFRYAQVDGWPGEIGPDDLRAVVCHTDMEPIGTFRCSDPMLNRLHENVRWSAKGNFVDVPTDCPQRDERLGWTGDLQVFMPTACFLFDCEAMLGSWLDDLAADQVRHGTVPPWVPYFELGPPLVPIAAWGDAAVIVPWALYEHFGDVERLRRHLPAMRRWVEQVAELAGPTHIWDRGLQLGDWLEPAAPSEQPWKARADAKVVATAYHAHTADLLARACAVAGTPEERDRYADLAAAVRRAFAAEYVTEAGRVVSESPTTYALALCLDLLPTAAQRAHAGARLRHLVHLDGHHIGTGFVGTPLICDALVEAGGVDDAYHLLTQTECPSWLYPITMGATTTWERWDAMRPDGSLNTPEMTSFNHYALGAVADFLHRRVAGLAPREPGYRSIAVRPLPGGGLAFAEASRRTPAGEWRVRWDREGAELTVRVQVPDGLTALVELPDGSPAAEVGAGTHELRCRTRAAADDPPRPGPLDRHGRPAS